MSTLPSTDETEILLVTANVGSIFEDPERLLKQWSTLFRQQLQERSPQFIAIHLQEVGGKTYEKSRESVKVFLDDLIKNEELRDYSAFYVFLDEDFKQKETFTALGNMYFIHKTLRSDTKIWNFNKLAWEPATDQIIHNGSIEAIPIKEKAKFPQNFFPECKWSRKGFMRTRWNIKGTIFDLVNIHLFHDASNLAACAESPSMYSKTRCNALVYTIERFHSDVQNELVPFFIFGDFNFRCDTKEVIEELTKNLALHRIETPKNETKLQYTNVDDNEVLAIGKKLFQHAEHQDIFKEPWLRRYDKELNTFGDILFEFDINFPPSYPFEEDPELPSNYMSTRCPSWCDRILLSQHAKEIISANTSSDIKYNIIGEHVCMGDHKPVFLQFRLKPNQGNISSLMPNTDDLMNKLDSIKSNLASGDAASSHHTQEVCASIKYVTITPITESEDGNAPTSQTIMREAAL